MKIYKCELSKKIDKVKNIVSKKSTIEALSGILVQDGYLIAANAEMSIKARLDIISGEQEQFIIPDRAFDLIKSLPDGELEISSNENHEVTIKMEKIKNTYNSFPPDNYAYSDRGIGETIGEATIESSKLKSLISHVLYAIPKQATDPKMTAMYVEAAKGKLNVIGLDGHIMAWDWEDFDGDLKFMVPRVAVEKLVSLDITGDVSITYDTFGAIFTFGEYEVYTRLVYGDYYKYETMFGRSNNHTKVRRADILDAITRAKLCTDEKVPVRIMLTGSTMNLSIVDSKSNYTETLQLLSSIKEELTIGFDSKLVQESIKAMDYEELDLWFGTDKFPMIISSDEGNARALVLPVTLRK